VYRALDVPFVRAAAMPLSLDLPSWPDLNAHAAAVPGWRAWLERVWGIPGVRGGGHRRQPSSGRAGRADHRREPEQRARRTPGRAGGAAVSAEGHRSGDSVRPVRWCGSGPLRADHLGQLVPAVPSRLLCQRRRTGRAAGTGRVARRGQPSRQRDDQSGRGRAMRIGRRARSDGGTTGFAMDDLSPERATGKCPPRGDDCGSRDP